ncbi:hypothetical protein HWV07_00900 [Natronomonas salina]|uniref:DUF7556 family protein n=1 Tax=Natronomonas salina TaxID=1710540 RepID=UPI0015B5D6A1|nr:hypothetical protein [Natronomonas salina]QLD87668.1 hypothetical protein HWV07_00900 [Natronomonas salina]
MQGKRPDLPEPESIEDGEEIICAYDDVDETPSFLVADITRDDAWLSIAVEEARELDAWR